MSGVEVDHHAECSVCGPITLTGRQRSLDAAVEAHVRNHAPSDRTVGPTKVTQWSTVREPPVDH